MMIWVIEHYSLIGTVLLGLLFAIGSAFGLGHAKGKSTAETAAKIETAETEKQAIKDMATRQTTVTTEAANVQENVNHMSDADVDSELLSKYSYGADKDGSR